MFKYFILFYVYVYLASLCVYSCERDAQWRPEPQKPQERGESRLGTAMWVLGAELRLRKTAAPSPHTPPVIRSFKSIYKTITCNSVNTFENILT